MPRKKDSKKKDKKDKVDQPVEKKEDNKKSQKKQRQKKEKKKDKQKKEKEIEEKPDKIDLNAYNVIFDEINLFSNELSKLSTKDIKQRIILLDGKLLWLEKESEEDLLSEEDTDEVLDVEMEMLEMGIDLESADEMKLAYEASAEEFSLEAIKADLAETKSIGDTLRDLLKDIEEDSVTEPIDELMSKFILFDLRVILERATNEVFRLEGKIKQMMQKGEDKEKIKKLFIDQRLATKRSLKEMLEKLKKEKPMLLLTEDKIKALKGLTHKQIADMKAKEEQDFDNMVNELLEE